MTDSTTNSGSTSLSEDRRRAVWLYWQIAVVIPIAVVIVLLAGGSGQAPAFIIGLAFLSTLIFLCSAVGMWGGLGNWPWRWIPIIAMAPALGFLGCFATKDSGPQFHVFCLSICFIVMLTSLGLRFWKGQLRFVSTNEVRPDALQFGIKHIFGWTTGVAVLFGIGRVVYPATFGVGSQWLLLLQIAAMGALISISVVINIWALLGQRITVVKSLTLIGGIAGAASINTTIMPGDAFFFWVTVCSQLLMSLALIGLRLNKLRFVK